MEPTTRNTFKDYCLRRLGQGVTKINISDDQSEDRIDDALDYWRDYHHSATERSFYAHQFTADDLTNKYITIPDTILEVSRVLKLRSVSSSASAFTSVKYQFMAHEVWNLGSGGLTPYYIAMRHIDQMDMLLGPAVNHRFNRHSDKLYIDTDWTAISAGSYMVAEVVSLVETTETWSDRWLQRYATALMKRQWGENMKKFNEVQLLGGITFNGQEIYNEAVEEINRLEEDMINSYSFPPLPMTY